MKAQKERLNRKVLEELKELDKEPIQLDDGIRIKASQCYTFSFHPKPHFLFNTNCSDDLRDKLHSIIKKYYESP